MFAKIIPTQTIVFLTLLFNITNIFSQPSRDTLAPMWNLIPVPNPSHIKVITFDSSDVMYIGIWGEGIFRSLNLGQNWTEINNGLTNKYITGIEITSNGVLYASTYGGGVFISTNNGALWTPINSGLPSLKVKALKIKYPDTCFVAIEGFGIYRLTNNGATKVRFTQGLWNYDINCITIGDNGSIVVGTNGDGVYYSIDGGRTWRRTGYANNFRVITSFAKSPIGEIFCGSYQGGVFSSADHGLTWTVFKRNDTLKNVTAVTYFNSAEPIAGTDRIGILRYDSRAYEDWRLTSLRDIGVTALARSRQGILFAGTIDGALYKSTNGGANWVSIRSSNNFISYFHSFNKTLFVVLNNNKSFRSTNYGMSWEELNTGNVALTAFYNDSSNRLFATARSLSAPRGYLLVSSDLGNSWDTVLAKNDTLFGTFANKGNIYFVAINFQPSNPRDPTSPRNDLLRSTDGGNTWNPLGVRSLAVQGISAIGFNTTGTVFVSLSDSVIKSTNNGNSWSISLNKSANTYRDIAFTKNGTIYVAGDFLVYRSTNDGNLWTTKSVSNLFQFINSITVTKYDQIIFTTYYGELQTSINNGTTWDSSSVYPGLLKENILFVKSDNNGYLWIVTSSNIYRSIDPQALPRPTLLEPANNAKALDLRTTFIWRELSDIDLYEMEISENMDFSVVNERIILKDTSRQNYYSFNYNTMYFWRVRTRLNNALGNWSETFTFSTIAEPPLLISPANNSGAINIRPTFVWHKVPDARGYTLQCSKSPSFDNIIFEKTLNKITDTTYSHNADLEYSTVYFWRVKANLDKTYTAWSETWKFKTKIPVVKLRYPPNTTYGVPINTKLQWTPPTSDAIYEVQIAFDENFENMFFDGTAQANDYFEPKILGYYTKYYWRVRPVDEFGPSDWSETWWFITVIQAPELISPENDSKNLRLPINFVWSSFDKATNHHIQIAKDKNFTEVVTDDSTLSENKYLAIKLDTYSKYFWRVCYKANSYKGLWSETFSFTTNIGTASLIYPPKDTTNMPLSFIFQWKSVPGAEYYEFLLSLDSNFIKDIIISSDQITSTQLLVQNLDYGTTYFWKVRAKSKESIGDWSDIWKFTTLEKQQSQVFEDDYGISINPNPTNGLLKISLVKNPAHIKSIKITNLLGETVYKFNSLSFNSETLVLDLTNLEKGIFFIIFEFDNNFIHRNFILLR